MVHREPPEIEPDRGSEPRITPRLRLAGLVGSPAARRVALPRLAFAGALVLAAIALIGIGGSWLVRLAVRYVDERPEHRIRFADIELSPPPDPWIVGGGPRILDEVRKEAKHGDSIALLDLDLKELAKDFRRCPWVKAVRRVDRSRRGRLVVELEYRKPVAVVEYRRKPPYFFVIDDEAVVLDDHDIRWASDKKPYRVDGMPRPLVLIWGLHPSMTPPQLGLPWKRIVDDGSTDDVDPMMARAARLARFLMDHQQAGKAPVFASISMPEHGPDSPFFLLDADENFVRWGKAPGDEKPGEPSAEARWEMLLNWVRDHGPIDAKGKDFLYFDATSAQIRRRSRSKAD